MVEKEYCTSVCFWKDKQTHILKSKVDYEVWEMGICGEFVCLFGLFFNVLKINIILINATTAIGNSLYAVLNKLNLNDGLQHQEIPTPAVVRIIPLTSWIL